MAFHFSRFISGADRADLEQRIFNTAAFFVGLISLLAFLLSLVAVHTLSRTFILGFASLLFCGIFYASRFKREFSISSTLFIFSTLLFANYLWLYEPGFRSATNYLYLFLLFLMLTIKPLKAHFAYTLLFIFNLVLVDFLIRYFPVFETDFPIPANQHYILTFFLVAFSIVGSYFKKNYERERAITIDSHRKLANLNQALENRNKHLVGFAHMVAHNLRSPVAGMKMLLNLYDLNKEPAEREDLMLHLKEGAYQLFEMVEDLSTVMKDYTQLDQDPQEVILEEALQKAKVALSGQIRERKALINAHFEVETVTYIEVYLESIFLNLLSNALKYAHPDRNPKIEVRSYLEGHKVMLCFKDNGLGIDTERFENQLFKMYKIFHPEAHQDSKGIGLFLIKNQVEMLGGKIWIESTPGEGSAFFIELYRV